jgi:hypothetical protein
MDFLDLSKRLLYYKRSDIRAAIIKSCEDREVSYRYGDNGFGKRPAILTYPDEILELVKEGVTSFHVSEEHWSNPLFLDTGMKKDELDSLRIGWDLVLDIDCPDFEFSKIIADSFIKALQKHGVESISCKFSGNKGFHIGVPYKAFPEYVYEKETKYLFPEGTKRIAKYLGEYIDNKDNSYEFSKMILSIAGIDEIAARIGKDKKDVIQLICSTCREPAKQKEDVKMHKVFCPYCQEPHDSTTSNFISCSKCKKIIKINEIEVKNPALNCTKCGNDTFIEKLNTQTILNLDTILISSRHMYRMPYSLHEKSGLVSLPIDPRRVTSFDKLEASPDKTTVNLKYAFLDDTLTKPGEAGFLITQAFDYKPLLKEEEKVKSNEKYSDNISSALPEQLFPPCIKKILEGLTDGKKRSLFLLTNFLSSVGWEYQNIEELLNEWNKKNAEPLREQAISSQVRYHKEKAQKVLPPNCREYYQDFNVCTPDNICSTIKNPVTYAAKRVRLSSTVGKKINRQVLTEDQKEIRRSYRAQIKNGKSPQKSA